MRKKSIMLLVATLLSTIYTIYLCTYFFGGVANSEGSEQIGGAIATALVMPHMLMFAIGAVFGWIGYFCKAAWGALVAAILYSVGTLLFIVYAMFGIPILVFGFIGFANQKKLNKANEAID